VTKPVRWSLFTDRCRDLARAAGFDEVILPTVWEQQTFIDKAGPEILRQMYTFDDKGGRPLCLIPEVTALVQETYRNVWSKQTRGPVKVFYVNRCYRYERPQAGRYREFTQFGVEYLGGRDPDDKAEVLSLARAMIDGVADVSESLSVKRGLDYYVEDGFEFEAASLGAQRQVAGGGRYATGIGFALGLDRLVLAATRDGMLDKLFSAS
jgi:histidyl-tRNA synthetase